MTGRINDGQAFELPTCRVCGKPFDVFCDDPPLTRSKDGSLTLRLEVMATCEHVIRAASPKDLTDLLAGGGDDR